MTTQALIVFNFNSIRVKKIYKTDSNRSKMEFSMQLKNMNLLNAYIAYERPLKEVVDVIVRCVA